MSGLPKGWISTELQEVVPNPQQDIVDGPFGSNLKATEYTESGVPIIRLQNVARNEFIEKNIKYVTDKKAEELKRHSFVAGDIAITKLGDPLGKAAIIPSKFQSGIIVADIVRLRIDSAFADKNYVVYALNSPLVCKELAEETKGTTRPRVNLGHIRGLQIPLAPLPEQKRIADKLDSTLARVEACRDRLDRIPALLKRFRQSILAAATSGRLTEDWRDASRHQIDLDELLKARLAVVGKESERKTLLRFLSELPPATGAEFDLPQSWIKTNIGTAGVVSNGSTPSRAEPAYWNGSIPWVSSGEVRDNEIHHTKEKISQAGFDGSSVRMLPPGTVLIAMIGEGKTRGQTSLLNIAACINQNVAGIVPIEGFLAPSFLWYWFQSQYEQTRMQGNGTGPQALNCQRVRELPLNLPPLPEQHEIVRRVETLFAYADRLEARLNRARQQAAQLTPALLAKAFRGELVPQDPADEPAAELLQRLAASRAAAPQPKRGRKAGAATH